jgi:hypothetical protein
MGSKGYMAGRMDRTPYTEMHDDDDNDDDDDDDGKGICCTTRLSASTDAHDWGGGLAFARQIPCTLALG